MWVPYRTDSDHSGCYTHNRQLEEYQQWVAIPGMSAKPANLRVSRGTNGVHTFLLFFIVVLTAWTTAENARVSAHVSHE